MVFSRKIVNQTLACTPVVLSQFLIGIGFAWTAPTLLKLKSADSVLGDITSNQLSWLASIHDVGKLLGPFISPLLADKIGRKPTLVLLAIMYCIIWSAIIFARHLYVLYAARILFGLTNGIHDVVGPVYSTENCSPNFRGIVGSVIVFAWYAGIFFEFVVATYLSYTFTAIANAAIVACLIAVLYFSVETPYFLTMKGNRIRAETNLNWLLGNYAVDRAKVVDELARIERTILEEKRKERSTFGRSSSSKADLKSIILVTVMHLLQAGTGSNAYGTYTSFIFSPCETLTSNEFAILYSTVPFFSLVASSFIVERMNRRSLVIGGYAGVTLSALCLYLLVFSRNKGHQLPLYPWILFGSVASSSMFSSLQAPAFYALKGELLPFKVRVIGTSLAVTGYSTTSFFVNKCFLPITENFGMETNFLIYFGVSLLLTVFLYCVLPETRGKTLHELQSMRRGERVLMSALIDKEAESDIEKTKIRTDGDEGRA